MGYHTSNVHSPMSFSYPLTSYTSSVMSPEQGSCITWNDTKYIAQSGCHTGFQDKGEIRKNVAKKRSIQYPSYGHSVIQIVHECKFRRGISPLPPCMTPWQYIQLTTSPWFVKVLEVPPVKRSEKHGSWCKGYTHHASSRLLSWTWALTIAVISNSEGLKKKQTQGEQKHN